jgi:hypothetical protein
MEPSLIEGDQRERWRRDGWCLLEDLLPADADATAQQDVAELLPSAEPVADELLNNGQSRTWNRFVCHDRRRQLVALDFPEAGHRHWAGETLDGVAARYPRLDTTPWREAAAAVAGR